MRTFFRADPDDKSAATAIPTLIRGAITTPLGQPHASLDISQCDGDVKSVAGLGNSDMKIRRPSKIFLYGVPMRWPSHISRSSGDVGGPQLTGLVTKGKLAGRDLFPAVGDFLAGLTANSSALVSYPRGIFARTYLDQFNLHSK